MRRHVADSISVAGWLCARHGVTYERFPQYGHRRFPLRHVDVLPLACPLAI